MNQERDMSKRKEKRGKKILNTLYLADIFIYEIIYIRM